MGACVMHRFIGLIARFGRDERGAFAVMFGLMAIVLIAMGGAVVDYVTLEQTRNRAQIALDAAALALQPEIFETPLDEEDIRVRAEAFMLERIGEEWGVVADALVIDTNVDEGSLYFRARVTVPTMFVTLVGVDTLSAQVQSEATRKKLALEVVMVLDNSGSMQSQNRMTYLKEAANCATNILFYTAVIDDPDNANTCVPAPDAEIVEEVQMGIVPFTMFVNVGPSNATANWIDKDGVSPISADNFDDDDDESTPFNGPVDRLQLFEDTANESWRGCVEARPHTSTDALDSNRYLDTDDTEAASSTPNTLFVPQFSPDLPSGYGGQSYISDEPAACQATGTCTVVTTNNSCTSQWSGCSSTTTTRTLVGDADTGSLANGHCTCSSTPVTNQWQTGNGGNRRYHRTRTWTCPFNYNVQNLSPIEMHERLCKYDGATVPTGFSNGPNADCTREPILPLTNDPDTVIDTIDDMVAEGGTNIHEGTVWGFRALSPDEPFNQGAPYDEATSKVLIIMTDGENTSYNLPYVNNWTPWYCSGTITSLTGNCYYSAYGWPRNDSVATPRLGPMGTANSNLVTQMNERTRQTCENAKAEGITVYTIGLSTANVSQSSQAEVEDMLQDCASSSDRAHLPASPTELKAVFESIANDLSALRLAL
jgi:Flp pilus assembly pilin Flp